MGESLTFKPGDVFHQLNVRSFLGSGLHGEVYLVDHPYKGLSFALKMMRLEDVADASRVRRALATGMANYRIQHANVIAVEDLGCEPDGRVWLLMEYLEGTSIAGLLACQRGKVSLPLAFHIAVDAAWGIDAAHEMRILHRDIKPENLWLTLEGVIKVLDFSLAKIIPDGVQTTKRKTGFGTPPYMSPEALRGYDIDARAEVYSLGLLLYELLAGRHPFVEAMRDTTEMIRRQLYVTPEPLSSVAGLPAYVDDFMRRAIAKDPGERFLTMAEMAQAMMALRDRLHDDAARGAVIVEIPPGEPAIAGDPWARAAYQAPRPAPELDAPPPLTQRRVVVLGGGTVRMPAGLGGTQPLPAEARGTRATLQGVGGNPTPSPSPQGGGEPEPEPERPRRSSPLPAVGTGRAWGFGQRVLVLAVAAAIVASLGAVGWMRRRPAPVAPAPPVSVTIAPAPPETPAPAETPAPPAPAGTTAPSRPTAHTGRATASPTPAPAAHAPPTPPTPPAAEPPATNPHRVFDVQP